MPKPAYAFAQGPNGLMIVVEELCLYQDDMDWSQARANCVRKGGDPATIFFVEHNEALNTPLFCAVIDAHDAMLEVWWSQQIFVDPFS